LNLERKKTHLVVMQNLEQFAVKSAQKIAPELCKKSLGKNPSESFFLYEAFSKYPHIVLLIHRAGNSGARFE
jgi:hypothetical protein